MILKILRVNSGFGELTNCYIVQDETTKETMVIDPGRKEKKKIKMLNIIEAKVKYIYIKHYHGNHIKDLKKKKKKKGGNILIHRFDAEGLRNKNISLTEYIGLGEINVEADSRVDDGDVIHLGDIEFKVIHTPGHTAGGSSLYCEKEKLLFSGDTLFRGTWGRTDLPTSNFEDIIKSITNKLLVLPEDTIVYPGHGKTTMISEEEPIYYNLKEKED